MNFHELCDSLNKYEGDIGNVDIIDLDDGLFVHQTTTISYAHLTNGHVAALAVAHENHGKLVEIIKNFKPHVIIRTEDGKEIESFKTLSFKDLSSAL